VPVVEQWAEVRRLHFVGGVSIRRLTWRFDIDRNTVRKAIRLSEPPRYERCPLPLEARSVQGRDPPLLREDLAAAEHARR